MWFFLTILLIFSASAIAVWAKIEGRKEITRIEKGELLADDFDIIEE